MNSKIYLDSNQIWKSDKNEEISYPEEANDFCFAIEENSFWFKHRNDSIYTIIKRYPFKNNFADIGSGNGFQAQFLTEKLPTKEIFLIEPGYAGCLNSRKRNLKNIYNLFFQEFPFEENKIDGVGLFDVIEHIEDDATFLTEIASYLPANSKIYIAVPAHHWLWSNIDNESGHYRRYNSKMIADLAKKCNLNVLHNGYYFWYLPLPILIKRVLVDKLSSKKSDDVIEEKNENHKANWLAKFILKIVNNIEIFMLKTFKMPFGASCIVVLEKK